MGGTTNGGAQHLVDGKYGISDLVDLDRLRGIFEKFTSATGFTIGFLDHPGLNILAATGWRDICTKFHRGCPASSEICVKSNRHLLDSINEPGQVTIEACENGLVDCATPIIIKGKHIASLATGQLLLEPPDPERFRRQAKLYGFDEVAYLAALAEIPVVAPDTLRKVTLFLGEIAFLISEMGYTNLVIREESKKLEMEIAERKLAEQENARLNLELREKNKEMENFLYVTTHDLRGPLVNIQGFSRNLEKYFSALAGTAAPEDKALALARIPSALSFIADSSRKMDALISALLKVSRLGRVEMKPETLDMNALVRSVLASLRWQLDEAGAELEVSDLPACRADAGAVSQLFGNLVDNAAKYRSKDRPLKIRVSGEKTTYGRALYTVSDNGAGIPALDLPKIWEIFYRRPEPGAGGGEGIGLPMVRRIAEKNGGSIRVQSKEGEGSAFTVELPCP